MSSSTKGIAKSFGVIAIIAIVSKVFGFARDAMLSHVYGASSITDAFNIVQFLPNFLFMVVNQAIAVGFIPVFLLVHKESKQKANSFTTTALIVFSLISGILCLALFAFPSFWIRLFATGFSSETSALAVRMLQLAAWSLLLQSISLIFSAYLNALKRFVVPACMGFVLDVSVIGCLLLSKGIDKPFLLGLAPLVNMVLQSLFLFISAKKNGFSFSVEFTESLPLLKRMMRVALPSILALGISQINYFVDKNISSNYVPGSVSALTLSSNIVNAIESVVVTSLATVLYSEFSKLAVESNGQQALALLRHTAERLLIFLIPISLFLFLAADPCVKLLYGHGAFTDESVALTGNCCRFYALAMPFIGLNVIVTRYFYSIGKANRVVISSSAGLLVNILGDLFVWKFTNFGAEGLAAVTAISNFVICLMMILFIRPSYTNGELKKTLPVFFFAYGSGFLSMCVASIPVTYFGIKAMGIPSIGIGFVLFSAIYLTVIALYCKHCHPGLFDVSSVFQKLFRRKKKKQNT